MNVHDTVPRWRILRPVHEGGKLSFARHPVFDAERIQRLSYGRDPINTLNYTSSVALQSTKSTWWNAVYGDGVGGALHFNYGLLRTLDDVIVAQLHTAGRLA
jgi:hypothetical protein